MFYTYLRGLVMLDYGQSMEMHFHNTEKFQI